MGIQYILCDLDNTVYPRESGLFPLIEERIKEYLRIRLGLTADEAAVVRRNYLRAYGFTLVGLMKHHRIDPEDYLDFVHEVDVEGTIGEDQGLIHMMSHIPLTKAIVTNGTERHALRVLCSLGVEHFFTHIFDIAFMDYCPKPHPSALHKVMGSLGATGEECLMLDDHPPTLATARTLGMTTIYVGREEQVESDYRIGEIKGLAEALRDLRLLDGSRAKGDVQ